MAAALKSRQRARQGDLATQPDPRILRDANGRVIDGREGLLARLTAAEFAKRTHATPDELGNRVWAMFIGEADLSRPKGSNPGQRWSQRDALAKARAICRRNPDLAVLVADIPPAICTLGASRGSGRRCNASCTSPGLGAISRLLRRWRLTA